MTTVVSASQGREVAALMDRLRSPRLPPQEEWQGIRLAVDKTLREVADAVGVDPMTVWRWEQGRSKPWPRHQDAYSAVLKALIHLARELRADQSQK
jgi:DNA-binding transcriptional regulator YiaG